MKKMSLVLVLLLTCVVLAGLNTVLADNTFELRAASHFPPTSAQAQLIAKFCEDIQKRTDNRVKFTYYPGQSLLDAPRLYEGAVSGLVDLAMAGMHFTKGRFPVMETIDLPLGYPSGWVSTHVINDFFENFRPKELSDSRPLFFHACGPNLLLLTRPIHKLEDLKGLSVRATGRIATTVQALGAVARPLTIPEAVDTASRGGLDGFMLPAEALKTWKIADVAHYIVKSWMVGNVYSFAVVMNKTTWDRLPKAVQNSIDDLSKQYIEKAALMWNEIDKEGYEYGLQAGLKVIELSPEERSRWKKVARGVVESYVGEKTAAGFARNEVESYLGFLESRIGYWTNRQIELGIKSVVGPEDIIAK
jgi:TRAP-type C4-dicarboxylate transport system substrate-binding protein